MYRYAHLGDLSSPETSLCIVKLLVAQLVSKTIDVFCHRSTDLLLLVMLGEELLPLSLLCLAHRLVVVGALLDWIRRPGAVVGELDLTCRLVPVGIV
jgi:hypothetical protein